MSSILKVDEIQDTSGNNIINENANTVTIGKSGDTVNVIGTLQNNGSAVGGITEADMWRLTTNITADENPISNNLERVDDASFAKIGTGMSVSSGVWTFPSTGLYQVGFTAAITCTTGDTVAFSLDVSQDNGSSFDNVVYGTKGGSGVTGDDGSNINLSSLVNVTDTSNVKVKFIAASISSGSRVTGFTDANMTSFYFIRLGDSQ
jgi:hypothetical protein